VLLTAIVILSVRASYTSSGGDGATVHRALKSAPVSAAGQTRTTPFHVRFALYDLGIYPRELHVKSGPVQINIDDYAGGGTSSLVVEKQVGETKLEVGQVQLELRTMRGQGQLNLEPGVYHVYIPDRPDNRSLLVVE
jgi:hypothetical protein